MRGFWIWVWLAVTACGGDKTEPTTDGDADADTDTDTDADTDLHTAVPPEDGPCPLLPPSGPTVDVPAGADLRDAVAGATDGATLLLADGAYDLVPPLVLDRSITLRSASGRRDAVTIDGNRRTGDLIEIRASGVTLAHLTVANAGSDAIAVVSDTASRRDVRIWDVAVVDPGRVAIVAEGASEAGLGLEDAEIACVAASLSDDARGRVGGQCETGGVDVAGARGVVVRDSRFEGFWCANDPAMVGIRFWRGSREVTVTRNVLADVGTGIAVGQSQDAIGRVWPDQPCGTAEVLQAVGATVTNNVVFGADPDLAASDDGLSVGILAESSCDVSILHNSVYAANAPALGSIRQRYPTTTGIVANNLVSHVILRIDDALADARSNVENAPFDTWFFPAQGDFHTAPGATWAVDQGDPTASVPDDVDGEPRDDGAPDIGADER